MKNHKTNRHLFYVKGCKQSVGWAMSPKLPIDNFKWKKKQSKFD